MPTVEGSITITAKSQNPITWQAKDIDVDGVLSDASLVGVTDIEWRLKNLCDGTTRNFKSSVVPSQLSFTAAGAITFIPLATDFPTLATYEFFIIATDANGEQMLPEHIRYTLEILDDYL